MANDKLIALTFLHPRSPKEFEADVGPETTGDHTLNGLIEAGFIEKADARKPYTLQLVRTGASLVRNQPLVAQGAVDGDRVQLILPAEGGALSAANVRSRLALDWRAMTGLTGPMVRSVRGYADSLARGRQKALSRAEGEAGHATQYLIEVERPMLAAPHAPLRAATLLVDASAALAHGYPRADPSIFVVSQPVPFSPRVHQRSGSVCIGRVWREARTQILLAHLVVHVLHWLGFDEPANGDSGYDPAAYAHWQDALGMKSLPCNVPYPMVPDDVTHGSAARSHAAEPIGLFRPRANAVIAPTGSVLFRAAGARS